MPWPTCCAKLWVERPRAVLAHKLSMPAPAEPRIEEEYVVAQGGLEVFVRRLHVPNPRAVVLIVHGHSEHSGRYLHVMRELAGWGYASVAPDHRGHGRTALLRGYFEGVEPIVDDLQLIRRQIRARWGTLPTFMWGHSMGGLLALRYLQRAQFDLAGAVLASAAARIPPRLSPQLVQGAQSLARWVPKLGIQRVGERSWSCNDPEIRRAAENDPLVYHGRMRAMTGWSLLQAMRVAVARLPEIRLPVLICHGSHDRVVPPEASRAIYDEIGSPDRALRIFPGFSHELHNDLRRSQYFGVLRAWLDAHCPPVDARTRERAGQTPALSPHEVEHVLEYVGSGGTGDALETPQSRQRAPT